APGAVAIPSHKHSTRILAPGAKFSPQAKFPEATWHQSSEFRPRRDFLRLR
ncbi:hypothetical protein A2U01_0059966, partial [Trifolium medium]|nr:hypothetical protein [Trifolium medium]